MWVSLQMRAALMTLIAHSTAIAGINGVAIQPRPAHAESSAASAAHSLDALIVSIEINNRLVDESSFVFRESKTVWLIPDALLSAQRVKIGDAPEQIDGVVYRRLQTGPGLALRYDRATASLSLDIAPQHFEELLISAKKETPATAPGQAVPALFFDYDLGMRYGSGDFGLDGIAGFGVSGAFGVAQSQWAFSSSADPSIVRLGSSLTIDHPDRLTTLILGDGVETTAPGLAPLAYGGVGWFSNFEIDPDFIDLALPFAEGIASAPGQLNIFVNNQRSFSDRIGEGNFLVSDLPATIGAAELKVVTADLAGRETSFVTPVYVAPDLLKPGLTAYSIAAGWDRRDGAGDGIEYGQVFLRGGYRRGVSRWLTVNSAGEANSDVINVSAGADFTIGALGAATFGVGASRLADDEKLGYSLTGALRRTASDFSFGVGVRYASRQFSQIGIEPGALAKARYDAQASAPVAGGRLSAIASYTENRDMQDTTLAQVGYTRKFGPGQIILSGSHTVSEDDTTEFRASYTMPFGAGASATSQLVRKDDGTVSASLAAGRSPPPGDGLGYGVNIDAADDGVDARAALSLRKRTFTGSLEGVRRNGKVSARARLRSGFVFADGALFASRDADNGAVLIETPGLHDTPVGFNHQQYGRTRNDGKALISAQPFMRHAVSVDESALPIDVSLEKSSVKLITGRGRVTKVEFPLAQNFSQTVVIELAGGGPPPRGTPVLADGDPKPLPVGHDGLAYLTADTSMRAFAIDMPNGRCTFEIDFEQMKSHAPQDGAWPVIVCDDGYGAQAAIDQTHTDHLPPPAQDQPAVRKTLASAAKPATSAHSQPIASRVIDENGAELLSGGLQAQNRELSLLQSSARASRSTQRARSDGARQRQFRGGRRYGHMAVITFADGREPPRGTLLHAGRRVAPFAVGYDGLAFLTGDSPSKRFSLKAGDRNCSFDAHFRKQRTRGEGNGAWPVYICR